MPIRVGRPSVLSSRVVYPGMVVEYDVGSRVRFIVREYYMLSKGEYLRPSYVRQQNLNDRTPVLGGRYTIRKKETNRHGVWLYHLDGEIEAPVTAHTLVLDTEVNDCPFGVGTSVSFSTAMAEANADFLKISFSEWLKEDTNSPLKIYQVINDYYVLAMKKDKKNNFPFVWEDLEVMTSPGD